MDGTTLIVSNTKYGHKICEDTSQESVHLSKLYKNMEAPGA